MIKLKKNEGFTLPELIAIISLISILLVLIFPNISDMSKKSRYSLHDSKIKTIETAGEKYGNAYINNFHECINGSEESYINSHCIIGISELVSKDYITADENYDIIDPATNEPFKGRVLLCYDPSKINIYAKYLEQDDTPQCRDINVATGEFMSLASGSGTGYNGGNQISIKILKNGKFDSMTCSSTNPSLASCKIEGNNLKITMNRVSEFTNESENVEIKVFGKTSDKDYEQTYQLKVYPTSLKIDEEGHENKCIKTNSSEEFNITKNNIGNLKVTTDAEAIKTNIIKDNSAIIINTLNKTGTFTINIKEENGNVESTIEKTIYELNLDKEIPSSMLLGNLEIFNLTYGGNDQVTISTDNPDALKLYKDDESNLMDTIVLSGNDSRFSIKAMNKGNAKITIRGNRCGIKEYNISVANLYLEDSEGVVYIGGENFETKIVGSNNASYTCTSSDEEAATCQVDGTTLKVIPGTKDSNNTTITVFGSNGGHEAINIETKMTSINLFNRSGGAISKVCSNVDTGPEESISASGLNMGSLSVTDVSDKNLLELTITENYIVPFNKNLSSLSGKYHPGTNTGVSKVTIKEGNGNQTTSFDYFVYKINTKTNENRYQVTIDDTIEIKLNSSATGPLRIASNQDESIANVVIDNQEYSYDVNALNETSLYVTGKKTGQTTLIITGTECGTITIVIDVQGKEFHLNLFNGTYTIGMNNTNEGKLSCFTEGTNDYCDITLPEFVETPGFNKRGYSSTKDSKTKEFDELDVIRLNESSSGRTLYANSVDETKPVCVFKSDMKMVKYEETEYYTLVCEESGSKASKHIDKNSFTISDELAAEVTDLQGPEEIKDSNNQVIGYTYKVGIKGKSLVGTFDIVLKENSLIDKFDNGNLEVKEEGIFVAEYTAVRRWYIGKENPTDVAAILYYNKELPPELKKDYPDKTYTLILYGSGDTKDYEFVDYLELPWLKEGFQAYIKRVIVTEGINGLGNGSLNNLIEAEEIILPESLERIGTGSLRDNSSLKSISIPASVKVISENALENCKNLESVELKEGLQEIQLGAFLNNGLKSLKIPSTVKTIGVNAFKSSEENMHLENLEFESNSQLKEIGDFAFQNHLLNTISIPASLESLGVSSFERGTPDLTEILFDSNSKLWFISNGAFSSCTQENVILPDSLQYIGNNALSLGTNGYDIHLGPNISSISMSFATGENWNSITVDEENPTYSSIEGVLFNKDGSTLIKMPDGYFNDKTSYSIPEGTITLKAESIVGVAKETDNRTEIIIPKSLTEINHLDNFLASPINKFTVDPENTTYASYDGVLYSKDGTIAYKIPLYYENEEYTFREGTKTIESYLGFASRSINKITIPASVTKIGVGAFYTDPNLAFREIYIDKDDDEIEIGSNSMYPLQLIDAPSYIRNVHIKSALLKSKILEKNNSDNLIITVEASNET